MTQTPHHFSLGGGLDLVTPAIKKPQGVAIAAENYEPRPNGYRRFDGFERYDGHPQPHDASYWKLNFDAGTAAISAGDTVTGATSSATGVALYDATVSTGAYVDSDATGYVVLTAVTGTFVTDENLQVSAATKCVSNGVAVEKGATTDTFHNAWLQAAIEAARALVGAVPGSGVIRGTWRYGGKSYAFRDNALATACIMYESSAAGWSEVDLGHSLYFTAGTAEFSEDEALTGGTSGATATIKRVIVQSGDWSTSDAAGYLVLYDVTDSFEAETITSAAGSATAAGANTANSFVDGGRFECINTNFYGASNLKRMYGVDGKSRGFEWDGSVFVPIDTGMTVDTPTHVAENNKHLFFSFPGGSLQHSGIGTPYIWTILSGASEIGIGDEITGIMAGISGVMAVFGRKKTAILYGTSAADWDLKDLDGEAGAIAWTVQKVAGKVISMDINGIHDLMTTQSYGNFKIGQLSVMVDPWLVSQKNAGGSILATVRVKSKNQYRVFYDSGDALVMDLSTGKPWILPFNYGMTVYCASGAEDDDDEEWIFFGSDDGYVYRAEVGTSFDDAAVVAFIRLAANHMGTPTRNKRSHNVAIELEAGPDTAIKVGCDFSYGNPEYPSQRQISLEVAGGGGFWGEVNWGEFYWSSQIEGVAEAYIEGMGTNFSLVVVSSAKYETPHTLHGVTYHYSDRGLAK